MILAHVQSAVGATFQIPLGTAIIEWEKRKLLLGGILLGVSLFLGAGTTYYLKRIRRQAREEAVRETSL